MQHHSGSQKFEKTVMTGTLKSSDGTQWILIKKNLNFWIQSTTKLLKLLVQRFAQKEMPVAEGVLSDFRLFVNSVMIPEVQTSTETDCFEKKWRVIKISID